MQLYLRPDGKMRNTVIKTADSKTLLANSVLDPTTNLYTTNHKIDYITVDHRDQGNPDYEKGKGYLVFGLDQNGNVNHLDAIR